MNATKLKAIKDLLRWKVPFGIFPVLLPAVMFLDQVNWWEWFTLLMGSLLTVLMVHVVDDIFGYLSGTDQLNADQKEEVGHPKALVRGDISIKGATTLAIGLFIGVLGTAAILLFYFDNSWWLLPLGLFTVFWGYSYSGAPLKLSYRGLGETVLIVCGGIAPVALCHLVIVDTITLESIWLGAFIGGIFSSVLMSAQQADIQGDLESGRNTLVVLLTKKWGGKGPQNFLRAYHFFWTMFLLIGAGVGITSRWTALCALPMMVYYMQWIANEAGQFYAGRNYSLLAWRLNFATLLLVYLIP